MLRIRLLFVDQTLLKAYSKAWADVGGEMNLESVESSNPVQMDGTVMIASTMVGWGYGCRHCKYHTIGLIVGRYNCAKNVCTAPHALTDKTTT